MPETTKDAAPSLGMVIGGSLARNIDAELGIRLAFPDKSGELQELSELVGTLGSLDISDVELARVLQSGVEAVEFQVQEDRLSEHEAMLAKGKVLAGNPDSQQADTYSWRQIDPDAQSGFADSLDGIRATFTSKPSDEPDEVSPLSEFDQLEMVDLLNRAVSPLLADLKDNTPLPMEHSGIKKIGKLAAKVVKLPFGRPYDEFLRPDERTQSSKDPARVSRKARELNKLLSQLVSDPHGFLAGLLIEERQGEIEQAAVEQLDKQIVALQVPLAVTSRLGRRAIDRPTTSTGRPDRGVAQPKLTVLVKDADTESHLAAQREVVEAVGTFELSMPWMPGGKGTAVVQQLSQNGRGIYITRGLPPKLEAIATESRGKVTVMADGLNQYDSIAKHNALRILQGIMPWHKNSGLQALASTRLADTYKGVAVWYNRDKSVKPRRLYFTFVKMSSLVDPLDPNIGKLNLDQNCLVVLAETDKASQIEALAVLNDVTDKYNRRRARD